jgi:hypothetical protein
VSRKSKVDEATCKSPELSSCVTESSACFPTLFDEIS